MDLTLAHLSVTDRPDMDFNVQARVELIIPETTPATVDVLLNLDLDRDRLRAMTFTEISDFAIQAAKDVLTASR